MPHVKPRNQPSPKRKMLANLTKCVLHLNACVRSLDLALTERPRNVIENR